MSGWNMIPLYVIKYFKDKKVLEILFNYSCRGYPFSFEKSSFLFHLSVIYRSSEKQTRKQTNKQKQLLQLQMKMYI